jgi:hypothetical protein
MQYEFEIKWVIKEAHKRKHKQKKNRIHYFIDYRNKLQGKGGLKISKFQFNNNNNKTHYLFIYVLNNQPKDQMRASNTK